MKWGPTHIENMNKKSCVTEELEHRMKACHPFVFSLFSSCLLLRSHNLQTLSTLNYLFYLVVSWKAQLQ